MKCEICKTREATVHYTEMKENEIFKLHLCEECAEERGYGEKKSEESDLSSSEYLGSMAGGEEEPSGEAEDPLRCEACGLTYPEFKSSGRLGCAECYRAFRVSLIPLFRRIHGSEKHTGKHPRECGDRPMKQREIRLLKERLEQSVRTEEFEEAARLRDQIRALEEDDGER